MSFIHLFFNVNHFVNYIVLKSGVFLFLIISEVGAMGGRAKPDWIINQNLAPIKFMNSLLPSMSPVVYTEYSGDGGAQY